MKQTSKHVASIAQLLEAGAHYGHLTRRWNPKMEPFVFGERNGIYIIDLRKTQVLLDLAARAARNIAETGKNILFIGTKTQAKNVIEEYAKKAETNYVSERWLGGMLTNFPTIRKSINRLKDVEKMEVDGTFEKITKKERLLLTREKDRLRKIFGGIETMTRLPGALFIVDIRKEHIAVKEAKRLGIPTIAIVDTNTDPEQVDFPIPANDDSIKTIELFLKIITEQMAKGGEVAKIRKAELAASSERASKEGEGKTRVKRQLRDRKPRRDDRGPRDNRPARDNAPVAKDKPADAKPQDIPKPEVKENTTKED